MMIVEKEKAEPQLVELHDHEIRNAKAIRSANRVKASPDLALPKDASL